ncbi:MAG: porphobilinogen synthase [Dehalococcoidia bacterium]|nr:MAG: porphobilinogen synthase [Dehalococcoidia bacterium]
MAEFPQVRLHRLRRWEQLRKMIAETEINAGDFIYPLFVASGHGIKREIGSMPGIFQLSTDLLAKEVEEIARLGIPAVILFGLPETKDELGSEAYSPQGVIQKAIPTVKEAVPDLVVVTDVCLCEYTSHGHCGIIVEGHVDNDRTLEILGKIAHSHAAAGADMVAPSDMMDGRVKAIREALDADGFHTTPIMSYAAKYASSFYAPFREAAECAPQFGDRRSYQMDPPNVREALREVAQDIAEGADIVMVKPALAYLDVIRKVRDTFNHPLAAYNVSGEFAMVKAAAQKGWLDERAVTLEILSAIKRAGADIIITYHAKEAARWLRSH